LAVTSEVKDELLENSTSDQNAILYETMALLRLSGTLTSCVDENNEVQIVFRCDFDTLDVAKHLEKSIRTIFEDDEKISFEHTQTKRGRYVLFIYSSVPEISSKMDFVTSTGKVAIGLPPRLVAAPTKYIPDALRGALLARGLVIEPEKSALIEITAPNMACGMGIMGLMRRVGISSHVRPVRSSSKVSIKDWSDAFRLLECVNAKRVQKIFSKQKKILDTSANVNRINNFDYANLARSARAAVKATAISKDALKIFGAKLPVNLAEAARLRIEHEGVSLEELAALSPTPTTKHALAGKLRRVSKMVEDYYRKNGERPPQ
jgi:DNA-binding protein WhiA